MPSREPIRRLAAWLLRRAHRLSPPPCQDWGEAMLAELGFVEGSWASLAWAVGGAGVLMKQSLAAFLTSSSAEPGAAGPFRFSPEGPMRRITLGLATAGTGVLLLLLIAPSFRQALDVSMHTWLGSSNQLPISESRLNRLAEQARAERDGETLAFVALQLPAGPTSVRIAEEAIALDPKLTWLYYTLASRDPRNPEAARWVARLQAWDPDNAAPRLLEALLEAAKFSDSRGAVSEDAGPLKADELWLKPMAAAFASPKYDSYLPTRLDLDRAVMARRRLANPLLVMHEIARWPIPNILMLRSYAGLAFDRGRDLEAKGNLAGAWSEYWAVARFGQVVGLDASTDIERLVAGNLLQREAYQRLESMAERSGHQDARALLAYENENLSRTRRDLLNRVPLIVVYVWNAKVGMAASLLLMFSVILLAGWGVQALIKRLQGGASGELKAGIQTVTGFVGALGLLVSSLTLYLSYQPYANLFDRFGQTRGATDAEWMMAFWGFAEVPQELSAFFSGGFWWVALLVLAACLLGFEAIRVVAGLRQERASA